MCDFRKINKILIFKTGEEIEVGPRKYFTWCSKYAKSANLPKRKDLVEPGFYSCVPASGVGQSYYDGQGFLSEGQDYEVIDYESHFH